MKLYLTNLRRLQMRYFQSFSIILLLLFGCQPKTKTEPVDLTAVKNAVNTQLDNFHQVWKAKDIDAIRTLLADDGLYCGTDPGEFWDKENLLKISARMFADESLVADYSIDKREIRVAADGNSATSLEQFTWNQLSQKIPLRFICHFVKIGDDWKIDFNSVSFIPKNADISKLNKALE